MSASMIQMQFFDVNQVPYQGYFTKFEHSPRKEAKTSKF